MIKRAFIFLGPPGSGKGSLSHLCVSNMGWKQFSTGNMCRKHINEQTEIGKQIDFIIKSGKLVSDELVGNMVDEWFSLCMQENSPLILDGFPRNVVQARHLLALIEKKYKLLRINIVRFIVADDVVVDRLCNRYVCQNFNCQAVYSGNVSSELRPKNMLQCDHCATILGRRSDDERETILNRLKVYRAFEQEMLTCLDGHERLDVDVNRSLTEIFETFKVSLKAL